jgi:4,5-DOPA dioxygenase extradiol
MPVPEILGSGEVKPMPPRMPVLFVGHGSPMNGILDNGYTRSLADLGGRLPRPKAILVVSAHWMTRGTRVMSADASPLLYDFYGFPERLYHVAYPCGGCPEGAERVTSLLGERVVTRDDRRRLDHGAWTVLKHLYPEADIPTFQLSMDVSLPPRGHYDLAVGLSPLRDEGILILGSGNLVHNLAMADFDDMDADPYPWAARFDRLLAEKLSSGTHRELIDYGNLSSDSALAVPTNDHYLPMLYVLALQESGDSVSFVHEGIQNGSVSMRSFLVGKFPA